ncbi:P27 family phage terminase small subunit [Metabacillus idriensis]|uniref:P27 family phage terminase small subunit n=1 Tax=Metabacillus idriensis TaxID=324768 RepID=UPI0017484DE5|nr:P27 family phage terminase small subunit [Metabacillus idriensis]
MNIEIESLYEKIIEQVEQLGVVRDTDKLVIERLAFNLYTIRKCEEQLLKEGFTTGSLHGMKEHSAVGVKNKAEAKIREAYILLGLDFASQLKKKISQEDKDEWSDFM